MRETWVGSLGLEDLLEKGMATHSSIRAWRIPWTEEPDGLHGIAKSWIWLSDLHFTSHGEWYWPIFSVKPDWYSWDKSHMVIMHYIFKILYHWIWFGNFFFAPLFVESDSKLLECQLHGGGNFPFLKFITVLQGLVRCPTHSRCSVSINV